MKSSPQQRARLRVCASCEWIYNGGWDCPLCGFASYGARYVYGDAAYRYEKTQQPWYDKKMNQCSLKLQMTIRQKLQRKFNDRGLIV